MSSRNLDLGLAASSGITVLPDVTTLPTVNQVMAVTQIAGTVVRTGFVNPPPSAGMLPLIGGTLTGPLNLTAPQPLDFNGGAGNYLQYYTATDGPRLRYMAGATEVFSFTDTGTLSLGMTAVGNIAIQIGGSRGAGLSTAVATLTGAALRLNTEQFISFTSADSRTLKFTATGGNHLSYAAGANELLSLTDTVLLTLGYSTANPALIINGNASTNKQIRWQSNGLLRWAMGLVNNESTGNAGSNFLLQSYDDTGASLMANVLTVTRSSGLATFGGALTVTGAATLSSSLRVNGTVGFNNTAPVAKPTVSGAKGSNAALASVIAALVSYGLVTDTTTA